LEKRRWIGVYDGEGKDWMVYIKDKIGWVWRKWMEKWRDDVEEEMEVEGGELNECWGMMKGRWKKYWKNWGRWMEDYI